MTNANCKERSESIECRNDHRSIEQLNEPNQQTSERLTQTIIELPISPNSTHLYWQLACWGPDQNDNRPLQGKKWINRMQEWSPLDRTTQWTKSTNERAFNSNNYRTADQSTHLYHSTCLLRKYTLWWQSFTARKEVIHHSIAGIKFQKVRFTALRGNFPVRSSNFNERVSVELKSNKLSNCRSVNSPLSATCLLRKALMTIVHCKELNVQVSGGNTESKQRTSGPFKQHSFPRNLTFGLISKLPDSNVLLYCLALGSRLLVALASEVILR